MEASETSANLREAAIRVIDERGEQAIRVHEIADKVGVDVTSIYHHFGNREGLIKAAQAERYVRSLRAELSVTSVMFASIETPGELRDALDRLLDEFFSPERAPVRLTRLNALGAAHGRERLLAAIADALGEIVDGLALLFGVFEQRGLIAEGLDLRAVAAWGLGMVFGRVLIELGPSGIDYAAWNDVAKRALFAVLFGPAPDGRGSLPQ